MLGTFSCLLADVRRIIYALNNSATKMVLLSKQFRREVEPTLAVLRRTLPISGRELHQYLTYIYSHPLAYNTAIVAYVPQEDFRIVWHVAHNPNAMPITRVKDHVKNMEQIMKRREAEVYYVTVYSDVVADTSQLSSIPILLPVYQLAITILLRRSMHACTHTDTHTDTQLSYAKRRQEAHEHYIHLLRGVLDDILMPLSANASALFERELYPDSFRLTANKSRTLVDIAQYHQQLARIDQQQADLMEMRIRDVHKRLFFIRYCFYNNHAETVYKPMRLMIEARILLKKFASICLQFSHVGGVDDTLPDSIGRISTPTLQTAKQLKTYIEELVTNNVSIKLKLMYCTTISPHVEYNDRLSLRRGEICFTDLATVLHPTYRPVGESTKYAYLLSTLEELGEQPLIVSLHVAKYLYSNLSCYGAALNEHFGRLFSPLNVSFLDLLRHSDVDPITIARQIGIQLTPERVENCLHIKERVILISNQLAILLCHRHEDRVSFCINRMKEACSWLGTCSFMQPI